MDKFSMNLFGPFQRKQQKISSFKSGSLKFEIEFMLQLDRASKSISNILTSNKLSISIQ